MKTAKEILMDKAIQKEDGFLSGQVGWIVEAMEDYNMINIEHELRMKHAEFEDRYEGRIETQEEQIESLTAQNLELRMEINSLKEALKNADEVIASINAHNNY